MDDTRIRFLAAITGRLDVDRIVELHLFSPIRQGVMETGVAVVAVMPSAEAPFEVLAETPSVPADEPSELADEAEIPSPYLDDETSITAGDLPAALSDIVVPALAERPAHNAAPDRHVIYTALYRLTRKGLDRGKWLFEMAATADAPLATVEHVARGVTLRSKDLTETERLSGEQLRALMGESSWRTPT